MPTTGHNAIDLDEPSVRNWRVSHLTRLGIPEPLAEIYADRIDWHQIAPAGPARLSPGSRSASSADDGTRTSAMTGCTNWRDEAACRDADSDLFFPVGTTGPALRQIDVAKLICPNCPVQARCLAWALENGVADGVWGGATPDERRIIRSPLQK